MTDLWFASGLALIEDSAFYYAKGKILFDQQITVKYSEPDHGFTTMLDPAVYHLLCSKAA